MDIPIIDIHTHLGDVLYADGANIIEQGIVRSSVRLDPLSFFERRLWRGLRVPNAVYTQAAKASMARSRTATRANMRRSMDANGISKCAVMAVPPNVSFAHLKAANERDPDMLPFTGVDYRELDNLAGQFSADIANGAVGLKLHPILQRYSLNSPQTFNIVEEFAVYNRPILFHSGESGYYVDSADQHLEAPELGNIEDATELVKAFPQAKFIVGHAGLDGAPAVMEQMGHLDNVWVDISFQDASRVAKLIETFGPERVMYASDWPWGNQFVSIRIIEQLAKEDRPLMRQLLHDNAAELLQLEPALA